MPAALEATETSPSRKSPLSIKLGLFLAAMGTVLLELLLTRLFSVSAGYHFAFMIVSIAMFGMTIGALHTFKRLPPDIETTKRALPGYAYCFCFSTVAVFALYNSTSDVLVGLNQFLWVTIAFLLFSVPFFFSGVCTCICLTRFTDIGPLYAADLGGAAIACLILVVGLTCADIATLFSVSALLAALAGFAFARGVETEASSGSIIFPAALIALCVASLWLPRSLERAGSKAEIEAIRWSPVGRVVVEPLRAATVTWAKVPLPESKPLDQKRFCIDFQTYSVMLKGDATEEQLEPVKQDVTAIGNILRPEGEILVVGAGGEKDVVTGLLYNQKQIDAVELNPVVVSMLRNEYSDFSGRIDKRANVNLICDEARTWLASSGRRYNLIQCSMVASWAASSSGAFMLSENLLYTREAFDLYFRHLKPHGILSLLRWGDEREPGQMLRLLNLAKTALSERNVTAIDFGRHAIVIGAPYRKSQLSIAELLVSADPFSQADLDLVRQYAKRNHYMIYWLPQGEMKGVFADFIRGTSRLRPGLPTDDCPFFFSPALPAAAEPSTTYLLSHAQGVFLLIYTLLMALVLVAATILVPFAGKLETIIATDRPRLRLLLTAVYFGSIAIGFMLTEVGLIERLTVLLGSPVYGLSVVLLALLAASGMGSLVLGMLASYRHDGKHDREHNREHNRRLLKNSAVLSFASIALSGLLSRFSVPLLEQFPIFVRIVAALVLVMPPGFFMGFCFPAGMKVFAKKSPAAAPWFWAVNGAASVLASILAALFSITIGITFTIELGAVFYLLALSGLILE